MNRLIRVLLIVLSCQLGAQEVLGQSKDTLSIYFEFGKSEIKPKQLRKIRSIPHRIYINDLDSVHYIGMADSVGSIKSNLALGRKRAKTVAQYSKKYFITQPKIVVTSQGEVTDKNPQRSRRVDVVFYSKAPKIEQVEVIPVPLPECLSRADSLLHRSLIHNIIYRRQPYVSIETYENLRGSNYYSARAIPRSTQPDSMAIYKLQWRRSKMDIHNTGSYDFYTRVPKADYEQFGVFKLDSGPCKGCSFEWQDYEDAKFETNIECIQVDRFLMNHLQAKRPIFSYNKFKVRVPRSLVNVSDKYYVGCYLGQEIDWRTVRSKRKWERWKRNSRWQQFLNRLFRKRKQRQEEKEFYYTELPASNDCLKQIVRKMDCCEEKSEPSECDKCYPTDGGPINCRSISFDRVDGSAEVGYVNILSENRYYAAAGIDFDIYSPAYNLNRGRVMFGFTDSSSLYINARFESTFLMVPFYGIKSSTAWTSIQSESSPKLWFMVSGGLSSIYMETHEHKMTLNNSVFLELQIFKSRRGLSNSLFFNSGYSYTAHGLTQPQLGPTFQAGLRLRL